MGLQDLLAGLAGADAVCLLDGHDEDLAVADAAGARVPEDRVDDGPHVAGRDDALDLDLRAQVVRQLGAAVALGDALLAPGALDLADRQRREPEHQQLRPDRLEGLMAGVRDHPLHAVTAGSGRRAGWRGDATPDRRRARPPPRRPPAGSAARPRRWRTP